MLWVKRITYDAREKRWHSMEWNGKGKEEKGMVIPKHLASTVMFYVIQSIGICTALFLVQKHL
jgi:hypothetical protein